MYQRLLWVNTSHFMFSLSVVLKELKHNNNKQQQQTNSVTNAQAKVCFLRAGVCRPCVETKLTASKKSATDSN